MERSELWERVVAATRPLNAETLDGRRALARVVRVVEEAREAGLDGAEMSRVRGLALVALEKEGRAQVVQAVARIHGAALLERAR